MTLLFQIYYYRICYDAGLEPLPSDNNPSAGTESTPLLAKKEDTVSLSRRTKVIAYSAAVIFVIGTGVVAWIVARTKGNDGDDGGREEDIIEWKSQVIGWCSALLYRSYPSLSNLLINKLTRM